MPLSSLFKRRKPEGAEPSRRDPSVDPVGEYASDQLDPELQLHWAGRPDRQLPLRRKTATGNRQTTWKALQTIREREIAQRR